MWPADSLARDPLIICAVSRGELQICSLPFIHERRLAHERACARCHMSCTYTHTHAHTCTHTHARVHTHAHLCTNMHARMHTHAQILDRCGSDYGVYNTKPRLMLIVLKTLLTPIQIESTFLKIIHFYSFVLQDSGLSVHNWQAI